MNPFSTFRNYLLNSSSIAIQVEGCVWANIDINNAEDMGCMEGESEDGTTFWYQMANCKRAQVAYSVYATNNEGDSENKSTTCQDDEYKETLVTTTGLSHFVSTLSTYSYNTPLNNNDLNGLPTTCEQEDSNDDGNSQFYLSIGCSSSGKFTIARFYDSYCTQYNSTMSKLTTFNSKMNKLHECYECANDLNNYEYDENNKNSYQLCSYLIPYSTTCNDFESPACYNFFMESKYEHVQSQVRRILAKINQQDRVKVGIGSMMLLSCMLVLLGIRRRSLLRENMIMSITNKNGVLS